MANDEQRYVLARQRIYGGRINEPGTILEPAERARLMSENVTAELVAEGTLVPFNPEKRYMLAHGLNYDLKPDGTPNRYEAGTIWEPPTTKMVMDERARMPRDLPMTPAEQEQLTASLVANGTLIPHEPTPAMVAAEKDRELARQVAENERLNAELEELKRRMGVPEYLGSASAKGGKS